MNAPLLPETASLSATLSAALVIGIGFGFALERAGLASARKLVAQFYGKDMSVLKVLFSALLVAMLGVFWLARLGWLDLSAVYVPPTFVLPQLLGGLVFGIGLVTAGLCPGTACVSAATGRIDGWVVLLGLFVGMVVTGLFLPQGASFYQSTFHGAWTLPEWLDLPYGVVVAGVVVLALVVFVVAERVERWSR
ncbi:YeeE/YedE family protein [Tahibacter amnicola]|uniref:YeeE/YedE family protein n=1 Tax=Tahibacter amnicola TaxID=2976241 RepID=A0ABY6BL50_9GAMM|nr:YeeE/YedE family protein [Tahibacter amnicola]UXI70590.1 YeeE/YedE family protein [Tahibacter amnicola]